MSVHAEVLQMIAVWDKNLEMGWSLKCLNRPLVSSKNSHFQNEAKCTIFLVKMSFTWYENEK